MITEKQKLHIQKLAQLKKIKHPKVELICKNCKRKYFVKFYRKETSLYCSRFCQLTSKERKKISQKIGKNNKGKRIGENNSNWKNGISSISNNIRTMNESRAWTLTVFERDNFTCQYCGDNKGGNLNAHHKIQLSEMIKKYKIKTIIDARNCKEIWDINNGITLCINCHRKEHSHGNIHRY